MRSGYSSAAFEWPVAEVDDPAAGGAVRPAVEVGADDVGEQDVSVSGIFGNQRLGFRGFHGEPEAENVGALKRDALVLVELLRVGRSP